jgi:predicted DNA-binding transcriptional regulator AlpA
MPLIRRKPAPEPEPAVVQPSRLFTPKQAAGLLQVSEFTLERWRRTGDGPPYVRLSARAIRYREVELTAFIEARVTRHTAHTED